MTERDAVATSRAPGHATPQSALPLAKRAVVRNGGGKSALQRDAGTRFSGGQAAASRHAGAFSRLVRQRTRKRALASARAGLAAAQELRRSDCDNLRRAQQANATSKRPSGWPTRQNTQLELIFEWRIGEMRAKMQAELREQLDALQISMEAEARSADAVEAERSRRCTTRWRGLCARVRG